MNYISRWVNQNQQRLSLDENDFVFILSTFQVQRKRRKNRWDGVARLLCLCWCVCSIVVVMCRRVGWEGEGEPRASKAAAHMVGSHQKAATNRNPCHSPPTNSLLSSNHPLFLKHVLHYYQNSWACSWPYDHGCQICNIISLPVKMAGPTKSLTHAPQ